MCHKLFQFITGHKKFQVRKFGSHFAFTEGVILEWGK